MRSIYYWDKNLKKVVEGYPPDENVYYGRSAAVIQDSIAPYYHPGACRIVESKQELAKLDLQYGTITSDKLIKVDPQAVAKKKELQKAERIKIYEEAVAKIDSGNAPLTQEMKELCARNNETLSQVLGIDAFNVAGKKNDERGKKYRKRS